MIPNSFEQQGRLIMLQGFKKKLKDLKKKHSLINKQFNALCDELDKQPLNEEYLQNITSHLTVYLSELDIIDKKIKEISEIIQRIITEISN
jgi:ABC-type phosphate transport system auxiliary subunit